MTRKHFMSFGELEDRANRLAVHLAAVAEPQRPSMLIVYPIPRGGIPAALALKEPMRRHGIELVLTHIPEQAAVAVDDLVDTGDTAARMLAQCGLKTYALIDKRNENMDAWVIFPWEESAAHSIEDAFTRLFQFIGEDPKREGLLETPARAAKAWEDWCSGYAQDPANVLKTFEDGADRYDEMVVVDDIPIYSHCEHHLAPIFGTATVAYVPNGRIVGLSKINRVVNIFARRLQVQERMTAQIADALVEHLRPRGCGVVIRARHMCMESRGVRQNSLTTTSALRGVFTEGTVRAEFLSLARSQ